MSFRRNRNAATTEERLRLLEAENAILNERSEDVLLLGLVAENIAALHDAASILETLLERVSILYEISYCGFGRLDGKKVELLHEFVAHVNTIDGTFLELSRQAVNTLENGALICSGSDAQAHGIDLQIRDIDPTQIILIPCSCRYEHRGIFIIAHDGPDPEYLPRKLIVLQQVIGLATARIDNILLLDELRLLNVDLETRVSERTIELHRAALALETEIAERQHTEKILAGERHRLRMVVEHLPEGVIVLDGEGRVVLANSAVREAEPLVGAIKSGEVLQSIGGRSLAQVEASASEPRWLEVAASSQEELIYEVAIRALGRDLPGRVIVLRNVTDQRAIADQLLRQERVAAMGHLAAGIAHDFNNLIQGVTILAESMLLDDTGELQILKKKTRDILALGERAASLIRQILDYSRQTVTRPQLIDLHSFLVETLNMLDRMIPETVQVELNAAPGSFTVRIDPVQLQQVLTNLTLNASQAMPNGGEIRVRLWNPRPTEFETEQFPPSEDGSWVGLSLTDTGCGIPPEAAVHVFEPFFTTKEQGQGTGLGLAQTYGIVKQNNGHIFFDTEIDRGTTFTLLFPVVPERADAHEKSSAQRTPPLGRDESVLVVEDDPTVRELTGELLEALGYLPVCAENGSEALDLLNNPEHAFQLVLSDVAMPTMGGVELAVELQRAHPSLPVVLMSGYAPDPLGGGFSSPNLAAWLQKPFSVDDLASTLAEVLSDR